MLDVTLNIVHRTKKPFRYVETAFFFTSLSSYLTFRWRFRIFRGTKEVANTVRA